MSDDEGPEEAIVRTLEELDKWRRRRDELEEELSRADQQVQYYESLAQDMKRQVRPPRVTDMLRALFNL
jgi:hypothetical protein